MTNATTLDEAFRRQQLIVPADFSLTTQGGRLPAGSIEQGMTILSGGERCCKVLAVSPVVASASGDVPVTMFRADALDQGVPLADVTVPSDSRLIVSGRQVRADRLVNTATVVSDVRRADRMVALEIAADAPFDLSGIVFAPADNDGETSDVDLLEVRRQLLERAVALGWRYGEDRRIQIAVDGCIVAPTVHDGTRWRVTLRRPSRDFRVFSASAIVEQQHPDTLDGRRLGVQVIAIQADGEEIALSSDAFTAGFHGIEHAPTYDFRWTDGAATMHLPSEARVVEFHIGAGIGTLGMRS